MIKVCLMSDTDSLSDYPSDIDFIEDNIDTYPDYNLDSGIESNDGYLTDINIEQDRNRRVTRNTRHLRKRLRYIYRGILER